MLLTVLVNLILRGTNLHNHKLGPKSVKCVSDTIRKSRGGGGGVDMIDYWVPQQQLLPCHTVLKS